MHNKSVFRKSAKGSEAIATRQHGLTPKLRSLLILIDGKRSVEELARMSAMFGDPMQLLAELESGGFIETDAASTSPPAASAAPAPAAPASPAQGAAQPSAGAVSQAPAGKVPLAEAKRFAVRKLTDLMGPMAESLCIKLESVRNAEEFNAMITRIETVLRETRGTSAATAYIQSLADHRPVGP